MNHNLAKSILAPWRQALYNFNDREKAQQALVAIAPNCCFRMCHPFVDTTGAENFYQKTYVPLTSAMPDFERRDYIVLAGEDQQGCEWVGCGGYYTGTFLSSWLDIPPTGHQVHLRFHEFYRLENDRVVEFQAVWDLPELMMQARSWPMVPSLGREWHVPAPASQDGLAIQGTEDEAKASRQHIIDMLACLQRHPHQGPASMEMERFWHPKMNWYGPAGIGTARGVAGFRHWHQIPFLRAMPDRGQLDHKLKIHFFAEGKYAAYTGWPDMMQTITNDGWLGIAPANQHITLRSLDFWRMENGLIRENWVLIDLLHIYAQVGVDVLARMEEMNKARNTGTINLTRDY